MENLKYIQKYWHPSFSVLVRVLHRDTDATERVAVDGERKVYDKELVPVIVEAEMSRDHASANSSPRKVGDVVPVQASRPENREVLM